MLTKAIKVIVVTEKLLLDKVTQLMEANGATGYTVVPSGGKGAHHFHPTSSKATVVDDFSNVKIETIIRDKAKALRITEVLVEEFFQNYPGITYLEEIEIHRPEKFGL